MTPLAIEILLKAYYSPEPHTACDTMPGREALEHFKAAGLIGPDGRVTEMGHAHVRQLCSLPYPRHGWIDANGVLIAEGTC